MTERLSTRTPTVRKTTVVRKKHKHEYSGLWWHFGQYGRQDVHIHSCWTLRCNAAVIGETPSCKGPKQPHVYTSLSKYKLIATLFRESAVAGK